MALVKCKECGAQISDQATACMKCGAPRVPDTNASPPKKKTGRAAWYLAALIAVGIVSSLASRNDANAPAAATNAAAQPVALTAAQEAAKQSESETRGLALIGAKTLKQSSKDPQTFEFTSIVTHPSLSVCYEYRAKNSFNAMLAGAAVLVKEKMLIHERDGKAFVAAWNKRCTPSDGEDVMRLISGLLE